jgi:hypothetical protein
MNAEHQGDFQLDAKPNWTAIRTDFEAGTVSTREIARREGVSDTAIHKRAKSEGWNTGLRKPENPSLQPAQTEVQTTVQTTLDAAGVDRIIDAIKTATGDDDADRFKWNTDNPDVLVWDRPSIAVYTNPFGQVIIRAESNTDEDDPCIRLDRRDIPALIRRLQELGERS